MSLERLISEGFCEKIDAQVVHNVLNGANLEFEIKKPLSFLLMHMQMSLRNGHFFIEIQDQKISPDPERIWTAKEEKLPLIPYEELKKNILKGLNELIPLLDTLPVVKVENRLYFSKMWQVEEALLKRLEVLNQAEPFYRPDKTLFKSKLDTFQLLPEQKKAILSCLEKPVTLLSGGPGTGKTYTAGLLIRLFLEGLLPNALANFRIELAAPTGKAAMNLQASLNRSLQEEKKTAFRPLEAKTLHSLLKPTAFYGQEGLRPLAADLILIDEASMIDSRQMLLLLQKISPGARLVLIGDPNQLPPIEPGAPFQEWIESGLMPVSALIKCQRAELKSIVDFAAFVQEGKKECAWSMIEKGTNELGITRFKGDENQLFHFIKEHYKTLNDFGDDYEAALKASCAFKALVPKTKGKWGVEGLNLALYKELIKGLGSKNFIAPVIATRNDYFYGLSNGESGLFVKRGKNREFLEIEEEDFLLFPHKEGGGFKKLAAFLVPDFSLAYALSIHKSQGSEYLKVLLLFPEGSESFGKKALYTAATRAKREFIFWGEKHSFSKALLE